MKTKIQIFLAKSIFIFKRTLISKIVQHHRYLSVHTIKAKEHLEFLNFKLISKSYVHISKNAIDKPGEAHYFEDRFALILKNGQSDMKTGMIFTNKGAIVLESSSWIPELLKIQQVPRPVDFLSSKTKLGLIVILPSQGFYHWLVEDLPLFLRTLDEFPSAKIAIWEDSPSYVTDLLHMLQLDFTELPRFINSREIAFISRGQDAGWPHRADVKILRSRLNPNFSIQNEKIYISRINARRSPVWEKEITETLRRNGWRIVELERMSLPEQIESISKAKLLAGVHGAGLSNMIWMNKGTHVIELMGEQRVNCFSRLAQVCELHFDRIEADPNDKDEGVRVLSEILKLTTD
jgi:hypothetical protein